jgi:hypothetical protein
MTSVDRQALRDAALKAQRATPPRSSVARVLSRWELQTSNSFRRIGCHGDGDVLCGTKHPYDGHPDLLSPSGVLDYIVAAQPRVVIQLLDDVDALEDKLAAAKALCDRIGDVEVRLNKVAGTITSLGEALAQLTSLDPEAVETARALVARIVSTLQEAPR